MRLPGTFRQYSSPRKRQTRRLTQDPFPVDRGRPVDPQSRVHWVIVRRPPDHMAGALARLRPGADIALAVATATGCLGQALQRRRRLMPLTQAFCTVDVRPCPCAGRKRTRPAMIQPRRAHASRKARETLHLPLSVSRRRHAIPRAFQTRDRALQQRGAVDVVLRGEHLDVGSPRVIVDRDVRAGDRPAGIAVNAVTDPPQSVARTSCPGRSGGRDAPLFCP